MTQMTFQNIRNLGANGNQPLITNQNDFQIFDNVTWIKGKHTLKAGGSITLRSREILNADTIIGNFNFNNNMTSNCAGQPAGCTVDSNTGFDVASFLLGLAAQKNRAPVQSDEPGEVQPYTESRPEYSLYMQDDFRVTQQADAQPRAAVGHRIRRGSRVDDRQSNFDVTTGQFVVASDDATIGGVDVGRYLQTYSKADFGPRLGFAYDLAGDGKTIVRGGCGMFWNFRPGGTSSSKAQNQPFLQSSQLTPTPSAYGSDLPSGDGPARLRAVRSDQLPPAGATRSVFDVDFRDAYARHCNLNVQRATRHELHGGDGLRRLTQGRQMVLKVDINQAPPVVGVSDANVNRPFITVAPRCAGIGQSTSIGHARLQRVPARSSSGGSRTTSRS